MEPLAVLSTFLCLYSPSPRVDAIVCGRTQQTSVDESRMTVTQLIVLQLAYVIPPQTDTIIPKCA